MRYTNGHQDSSNRPTSPKDRRISILYSKQKFREPLSTKQPFILNTYRSTWPHTIERIVRNNQRLGADYKVSIPPEMAEYAGWEIGSELWIDIFDKDLAQIVIGRKLSGDLARKSLKRLRELGSEDE